MSRLHNNLITINWCSAGRGSSADRPVGPSGEIERKQRIWSPASTDGCYILHTLLCTLAYCREEATDSDVPLTKPKQVPKCMQFGSFNSVFYSSDYDYDESSGYISTFGFGFVRGTSLKRKLFSVSFITETF